MKTTSQLSRKEKDAHVKAWQSSGLTQAEYSLRFNINYSTFKNWVRFYRNKNDAHQSTCSGVEDSSFIPLNFNIEDTTVKGTTELMITYPNGVKVSCAGIDINQVLQLIKHY
jgi:hypothetical protein